MPTTFPPRPEVRRDPAPGRPAWFTPEQLDRRRSLGLPPDTLVVAAMLDDRPALPGAPGASLVGYVAVTAEGAVLVLHGGPEVEAWGSPDLAAAIAEELGASWADVRVRPGPWGACRVGGAVLADRMRLAAARAREMLKAAAADAWGLPSAAGLGAVCSTVTDGVRARSFASLAADAAGRAVPPSPGLLRAGAHGR